MLTKPRNAPRASSTSMYAPNRRRRLSPLMIIGISVPVLLVLIGAGVVVALPKLFSHAAAVVNPNCTLIVPARALTAQGLATPYQLFAPDAAANGPCNEANPNQGAFVQATIYDPAAHTFSIYSPLVIDKGTKPAAAPVVPKLPPNAIVALEFGFNGTLMTLQGTNAKTLANAKCVNGLNGSVFGQYAYCNAVNFFTKVNADIAAGTVVVPPVGVGTDGQPCPTTRDFKIVDMDQSDNVQTQYLANANGQTAQLTAANQALLANAVTLGNPSDNALVTKFVDPALGCKPWTAPDLANKGTPNLSMALDEIAANAFQGAPIALVPSGDEMVLVNNNPSMRKTTLYRAGVDQTPATAANANTTTYCTNLLNVGLPNIQKDITLFANATSPAPAMATNLFTFLATRFNATFGAGGLNCIGLLNVANPVTLTTANGITTAATITLAGATTGATTGTTTGTTATQTATGTATINLNANAGNAALALNVTYPNHPNAAITVSIATTAGTPVFSQQVNTDNNSQAALNSVINNLQGLTAIPNTWVFNVADPNMNNTIVGSGSVTSNGTTGTATLGTLTPAAANNTAACTTGNATTGNAVATPTVAATGNAVATPTVAATGNAAAATPTVAAATPTMAATTACTGTTAATPAAAQPTAPAVTTMNTKHHHHHMW